MAFLGSVFGTPTVPLSVDSFGQTGSLGEVYRDAGIGVADIVGAAYLALELCGE